jgi:hypothetical protein
MTSEIQAIIEKNLPAEVGNTLKIVLERGEKDAQRVEVLGVDLKNAKEQISDITAKLNKYISLDKYQDELDKREKAISEKERNQKVIEAELKAVEAEKRAGELAGFVGMVFKSPIFRKSIFGSQPVPSGQYGVVTQGFNKETTVAEE